MSIPITVRAGAAAFLVSTAGGRTVSIVSPEYACMTPTEAIELAHALVKMATDCRVAEGAAMASQRAQPITSVDDPRVRGDG